MADLPDPATLSDEDLDKILAGELPPEEEETDEPEGDAPTDEEQPEEEETPAEEPAPAPATEEVVEEEEQRPPSRREQLRVQQLLAKIRQPNQPVAAVPENPQLLNYSKELDTDEETIKRLEADRTAAQNSSLKQAEQMARAMQWETMLNIDAPNVEQQYAVLNPKDTEHFHPAVADALSREYLQMVGYDPASKTVRNPGIRWSEFVEARMELAEEIAANRVVEATKSIKSQAAKTALRPDGSRAKRMNLNKAAEDMTDEELDAKMKSLGL